MKRRVIAVMPVMAWTTLRPLLTVLLLAGTASSCASRLVQRGAAERLPVPASGAGAAGALSRARSEDALSEAQARAGQSPAEPYWPYRVAEIEAAAGHAAPAETALRSALARDSVYAPALTLLSRLYYEQGRYADAIRLLAPLRDARVPLDPAARSVALAGLALHEAALGHDDEARALVGGLAPRERTGAAGVAAWLAVRGASADSATRLAEAALEVRPLSAANHNNLGIARLRAADPDGAAREFERAIALDPALPGPWYNMAILERWYRLDRGAAAARFREYWARSHADPDSLRADLGRDSAAPVTEEGPNR